MRREACDTIRPLSDSVSSIETCLQHQVLIYWCIGVPCDNDCIDPVSRVFAPILALVVIWEAKKETIKLSFIPPHRSIACRARGG